jgi:hypothetical protein
VTRRGAAIETRDVLGGEGRIKGLALPEDLGQPGEAQFKKENPCLKTPVPRLPLGADLEITRRPCGLLRAPSRSRYGLSPGDNAGHRPRDSMLDTMVI